MRKNYYEQPTDKEKLDMIGRVVDQLVRTADACFKLSEAEKCDIVKCAFSGIHRVMDNRYKTIRNRVSVHKEW